jgi:hypothetical protein
MVKNNYCVQQGDYLYNDILKNKLIGENFGMPCQDIELLMHAFHLYLNKLYNQIFLEV